MNTQPDENDTVPRYMYDQLKVAYQRQRDRNRELRKQRDLLRAALEQPEQEPVAWFYTSKLAGNERYITPYEKDLSTYKAEDIWPLYLHPPRREWQGLTDGEITDIFEAEPRYHYPPIGATDREFARDIEAALKERNHG